MSVPGMEPSSEDRLDRTFQALSDGSRRRLWALLGDRPGATTSELAAGLPKLSRWAVMKHLAVLREAGLVETLPRGRQRCHYRVEGGLTDVRSWLESAARDRTPVSRRASRPGAP